MEEELLKGFLFQTQDNPAKSGRVNTGMAESDIKTIPKADTKTGIKTDILDSLTSLPIQKTDSEKTDSEMDELLKEIQSSRISSLREAIQDIQELIEARKILHKEIFQDLESIKTDISNFILQLGTEANKAEQLKLRQKQIDIEEIKIQEKLNCWRDIADLKKELRERVQEFREKESNLSTIDKIME